MQDGLLHVDLVRPIPEPQVRKIKIENADDGGGGGRNIDLAIDAE